MNRLASSTGIIIEPGEDQRLTEVYRTGRHRNEPSSLSVVIISIHQQHERWSCIPHQGGACARARTGPHLHRRTSSLGGVASRRCRRRRRRRYTGYIASSAEVVIWSTGDASLDPSPIPLPPPDPDVGKPPAQVDASSRSLANESIRRPTSSLPRLPPDDLTPNSAPSDGLRWDPEV